MTTYNTGNPLGSASAKDLYDNAENLDTAVNDTSLDTWADRLGRSRKTMSGMERQFDAAEDYRETTFVSTQADKQNRFNDFIASSGYQFLGDYAAGIEITEYNQIVRDSDGEFWRLSGQVGLPYTTTGAGLPEDDALIPVGDAVLRQELANPDMGAAMVGFKQDGIGAVDRTLLNKVKDIITPEDFGAVGDGLADDTDQFNLAVSAAQGKTLQLKGEYRVNSVVPLSNINISGKGVVIKSDTVSARLFEVGSDVLIDGVTLKSLGGADNAYSIMYFSEGAKNIQLRNVSFIEEGATYSAITASNPTEGELYTNNVEDVIVDTCYFNGFTRPIYVASIDHMKILNCTFEDCRYDAIRTRKNMEYLLIDGNTFRRIGVYPPPDAQTRDVLDTYWAGRSLIFTNNIIEQCACIGADIKGSTQNEPGEETGSEATSRRILIDGNIFKDCWAGGISVTGEKMSIIDISNNIIQTTSNSDPNVAGIYLEGKFVNVRSNFIIDCGRGVNIGAPTRGHILIDGNQFVNNASEDMTISSGSTIRVTNNAFNAYDADQPSRISVSCAALRITNYTSNKSLSFEGNTFNKPGSRVFATAPNFEFIRHWRDNRIVSGEIATGDARIYRDTTVYHSDRGHIGTRPEGLIANYNVGDAIVRYGETNELMIVGLDTGTTLGTASVVRNSHTVTTDAGFDFASISIGSWISFGGSVLGVYRVVEFDSAANTITVDVALERAATAVPVTIRPKKLFSVTLS